MELTTTTPDHHNTGSPQHWITTTLDHHNTGSPQHRITTTPDHHNTGSPQHWITTTLDHHNTGSPQHWITTTPDHHNTGSPQHRITTTLDHHNTGSPQHRITTTLDHHNTGSPQHRSPQHRITTTPITTTPWQNNKINELNPFFTVLDMNVINFEGSGFSPLSPFPGSNLVSLLCSHTFLALDIGGGAPPASTVRARLLFWKIRPHPWFDAPVKADDDRPSIVYRGWQFHSASSTYPRIWILSPHKQSSFPEKAFWGKKWCQCLDCSSWLGSLHWGGSCTDIFCLREATEKSMKTGTSDAAFES